MDVQEEISEMAPVLRGSEEGEKTRVALSPADSNGTKTSNPNLGEASTAATEDRKTGEAAVTPESDTEKWVRDMLARALVHGPRAHSQARVHVISEESLRRVYSFEDYVRAMLERPALSVSSGGLGHL